MRGPGSCLVRYDGNVPGYSYAGDNNTRPFNGSSTLAERAYFDDFRLSTLSYQPFTSGSGVFEFHSLNSTGTLEYNWLDMKGSAPLYYGNRIEKYVFNVTASSLAPLLSEGYVYQNVTMVGCWQHESVCDLNQNYSLVPFLWNGRLNIVSVDSNGNAIPSTPISLTINNPAPLDTWLIGNFERVFGDDPQALRAFEADLYPTNQTMTISGEGRLERHPEPDEPRSPSDFHNSGRRFALRELHLHPSSRERYHCFCPELPERDDLERERYDPPLVVQHGSGQPGIPSNRYDGRLSIHVPGTCELVGVGRGEHDGAPDPVGVRLPAIRLLADGREPHLVREHAGRRGQPPRDAEARP